MFKIGKWFRFEAAHQLPMLPHSHKCHNLHGHSYHVQIVLESPTLDQFGFVRDYGDLSEFRAVIESLDHKTLLAKNERLGVPNCQMVRLPIEHTSAELMAQWLFEQAVTFYGEQVVSVEVRETETSFARYER